MNMVLFDICVVYNMHKQRQVLIADSSVKGIFLEIIWKKEKTMIFLSRLKRFAVLFGHLLHTTFQMLYGGWRISKLPSQSYQSLAVLDYARIPPIPTKPMSWEGGLWKVGFLF